jgi:hypothetical protein
MVRLCIAMMNFKNLDIDITTGIAVILWLGALVLASVYLGILNALLNIPYWFLSVVEVSEFIGFVLAGNDPFALLTAELTREVASIRIGLVALPAWIASLWATGRNAEGIREQAAVASQLLICPLTAVLAIVVTTRN